MTEGPRAPLCIVCKERAAAYTCPRCNARYCALPCYKCHSDRCTEGFYRESAVQELRSITATHDEKQRMQEILQRLHEAELGGDDDGSSSSSSSGGEDADELGGPHFGGLSQATLRRLLAKAQACGGALDVSEADLSPTELAAFHRALAAGELAGAVAPWEPWWLAPEAEALELGVAGTALVAPAGGTDSGDIGPPAEGAGAAGAGATTLPAPPSKPLPPLSSLTRAPPSPLLQYQLLDLLYAYCHTLRLYNGDWQSAPAEAAGVLFAISAVLAGAASHAPLAAAAASDGSAVAATPPAATTATALLACITAACQPLVGGREQRGFAVALLTDVAAVLRCGRPLVVTALMDLTRLIEAARQEQEQQQQGQPPPRSSSSAGGGGGDVDAGPAKAARALARRLLAAQRKLLFFLSWANEQSPELYALLHLAVEAEHAQHAASLAPAAGQGAGPAAVAVAGAATRQHGALPRLQPPSPRRSRSCRIECQGHVTCAD